MACNLNMSFFPSVIGRYRCYNLQLVKTKLLSCLNATLNSHSKFDLCESSDENPYVVQNMTSEFVLWRNLILKYGMKIFKQKNESPKFICQLALTVKNVKCFPWECNWALTVWWICEHESHQQCHLAFIQNNFFLHSSKSIHFGIFLREISLSFTLN